MSAESSDWADLGRASFVSLGTFRRNGEVVRTPVWLAADGERLVVTTEVETGKVRRLRHDPRVVMRRCDRFGALAEGAPDVEGRAIVAPAGAATERAMRSLGAKYGLQFRLVLGFERLVRRVQRKPFERVILAISAVPPAGHASDHAGT